MPDFSTFMAVLIGTFVGFCGIASIVVCIMLHCCDRNCRCIYSCCECNYIKCCRNKKPEPNIIEMKEII
jgi:hypothetical protein